MSELIIRRNFLATQGSRDKKTHQYTALASITGNIRHGFVNAVDSSALERLLSDETSRLNNQHLDDILGWATLENIGMYLLHQIKESGVNKLCIQDESASVTLSIEDITDMNFDRFIKYNKTISSLRKGDLYAARDAASTLIEEYPDFADAYNLRGRCQKYLKEFILAIADFKKALLLDSTCAEAHRNLGNAFLEIENLPSAITELTMAVEMLPYSAIAVNNRGYAFFKNHDFKLALRDHEKAIKIDRFYAEAYEDRANAYRALNDHAAAQQDMLTANDLRCSGKDTYANIKHY